MVSDPFRVSLLVAMVLSLLILPAWRGMQIGAYHAVASGFCLALLCADSYSLAPSAFLFMGSSVLFASAQALATQVRPLILQLGSGFAAGCFVLLFWMLIYADLLGYLVFHVINNQVNYARYGTHGFGVALRSFIPSLAPTAIVQSGAAIACISGLLILLITTPKGAAVRPITSLAAASLCFTAMLMLNFRGGFGFQDGAFVLASFALLALALPICAELAGAGSDVRLAWPVTAAMMGILACFEIVDRAALTSPAMLTRQQVLGWPHLHLAEADGMPIVRRLHEILRPGERLLALVYDPEAYLYSGFLPIHKFHEYLPWEADYARNPWFGEDRDLCKEVAVRPPPAIIYDGWKVWNRYSPSDFMPCIPALLAADYVADPIPTLFIRKDRLPAPN